MAEQVRQRTGQVEDVRGSGIYPATGPLPPGNAVVRSPAAFGHPEERHAARAAMTTEWCEKTALLAGRSILGGFFLYNGINHFLQHRAMTEYARSKGVSSADAAVAGSGVLIVAGGLSLLTGAWPKVGAGLISAFLLGVSPRMHAFWREQEPQRTHEMVNFTKNMALVGACCLAAAHPEPWPWSLAPRRHRTLPAPA